MNWMTNNKVSACRSVLTQRNPTGAYKYYCFFGLLLAVILFTACGGADKQENTGVILTSPTFPEIKNIRENITATVKVGDKTCELTIDPDTTLSGKCDALDFNTYSYIIEYRDNQYKVLLASASGTVIIKSGGYQRFDLSPLDKNFDKDSDGFTNLQEIVAGSDPTDLDSKPRQVAQIKINETDVTVEAGNTTQLTWTVTDNSGSDYLTAPLEWSSSNETVATVTLSGIVTGVKNGSVEIVAKDTFSGLQASVIVEVEGESESDELPESLEQGLVAYYPFNGNARDESVNNFNGTLFGLSQASDRFGESDGSFLFDGNNSYITVSNTPHLQLVDANYTISLWVNFVSWNQDYLTALLHKRSDNWSEGWFLGVVGHKHSSSRVGQVSFALETEENNPTLTTNKSLELNHWSHLVVKYDFSSQQLKVYIDGKLEAIGTDFLTGNVSNVDMYIGRDSTSTYDYFMHGRLDDIRIYNRALTEQEIKALYHEGGWPLD